MEDARVRSRFLPVAATAVATMLVSLALPESVSARMVPSEPHAPAGRHRLFRFKRMERCFMHKINWQRARHGRRHLRWDKQIGYVARRHARRMARRGSVWHDGRLGRLVTHWRSLGQNTGGGYHCRSLFRSFWGSSGHRANILGRWRFVGVGTKRRNGYLYVQQVFEYRWNPGNVFSYP